MRRLAIAFLFFSCAAHARAADVYLQMQAAVPPRVHDRALALLAATGTRVVELPAEQAAPPAGGGLVLAIGDVPLARAAVPDTMLAAQGPEGFVVRAVTLSGARPR